MTRITRKQTLSSLSLSYARQILMYSQHGQGLWSLIFHPVFKTNFTVFVIKLFEKDLFTCNLHLLNSGDIFYYIQIYYHDLKCFPDKV